MEDGRGICVALRAMRALSTLYLLCIMLLRLALSWHQHPLPCACWCTVGGEEGAEYVGRVQWAQVDEGGTTADSDADDAGAYADAGIPKWQLGFGVSNGSWRFEF